MRFVDEPTVHGQIVSRALPGPDATHVQTPRSAPPTEIPLNPPQTMLIGSSRHAALTDGRAN